METLWIVAANTDDYGRVYLVDYAGRFRHDVERKVMDAARREGYTDALADRLKFLGWEIVCLRIQEVPPDD